MSENKNNKNYDERGSIHTSIDERELRLFRSLDNNNSGHIVISDLIDCINEIGVKDDDVRLQKSFNSLTKIQLTR